MELKNVIEKRASVRQFTDEMVALSDIKEIVRLAGLAPSVNNSQPWKFIAVSNKETLKCMSESVKNKINEIIPDSNDDEKQKSKSKVFWFSTFFVDAPLVVCVAESPYEAVADKALNCEAVDHEKLNALRGQPNVQSIGACVQNLVLAATDLGYGTCWLSGPLVAREEIESCLKIEKPWKLATMVAIGKPVTDATQKQKKSLDEILEILD